MPSLNAETGRKVGFDPPDARLTFVAGACAGIATANVRKIADISKNLRFNIVKKT